MHIILRFVLIFVVFIFGGRSVSQNWNGGIGDGFDKNTSTNNTTVIVSPFNGSTGDGFNHASSVNYSTYFSMFSGGVSDGASASSGVYQNLSNGVISGTITDHETDNPVYNSRVFTEGSNLGSLETFTDREGRFTLTNVPFGYGYEVTATKQGYETTTVSDIDVTSSNFNVTVDMEMDPSETYSEYRIVSLAMAPNPSPLEIPEGGTGYVWYAVEGYNGTSWLPVFYVDVNAEDEQGNPVLCYASGLAYRFLSSFYHIQNLSSFCVKVNYDAIGNGDVGDEEDITITTVNGTALDPSDQVTFNAEIVPYYYTCNWGYRIYSKVGAGVGVPGIVSATGFAGGGSGSTISLELQGLSSNPEWSEFKIYRKDDLFVGAEVSVGPSSLLKTNVVELGATSSVTASFPYQNEYEFDMDDLEGLEALMAFYLFSEPTILYAGSVLPGGQVTVNFLSWTVEALIANSGNNGLNIARVSDETGFDIEGSFGLNANLGFGSSQSTKLKLGAGLGASIHGGTSINENINDSIQRNLYLGGGYNFSVGPKIFNLELSKYSMFYPRSFNQLSLPSSLDVEFGMTGTWDNTTWKSTKLKGSIESNSDALNFYELQGAKQKYTGYFVIDDTDLKNMLSNVAELPSELYNVGSTAVNIALDNNSFKQDMSNFMDAVYQEQNDDQPVLLDFGYELEDKSEFAMGMDFNFPLPVFPAVHINIGGGLEATNSREYDLGKGYWVKGVPHLQYEMPDPPDPQETLFTVMDELWDNVTAGNVWEELKNVIISHLMHKVIKWLATDALTQSIELNDNGSVLTIWPQSIPTYLDSVVCRYWEWEDENASRSYSPKQQKQIRNYIKQLRRLREEAVGMHYGIGGFYKFEPDSATFADSTLLSISYPDSAVTGLNEAELSMYWEDSLGVWHYLPSTPYPDSNKVEAYIEEFTTYALAPRLPHGSYTLSSSPDSLLSNGTSVATISSDTIYNNDSTIMVDSTLFTIETTGGTILAADADTSRAGIQIYSDSCKISFQIESDTITKTIEVKAKSVNGYATCEVEVPLYDTLLPAAPVLDSITVHSDTVMAYWQLVDEPDIAKYNVYFDPDSDTPPYNGIATVYGDSSPVDAGITSTHQIMGLFADSTYYVAITAVDIAGNESPYSNVLSVNPGLPTTLYLEETEISSTDTICYDATEYVEIPTGSYTFEIDSGGSVTVISGNKIAIKPGFKADSGSYFHGSITTTGSYCSAVPVPQMPETIINEHPETDIIIISNEPEAEEPYKVYPNPTHDIITIEFNQECKAERCYYEIYDYMGKMTDRIVITSRKQQIDLTGKQDGVYFILIRNGDSVYRIKVVKV